MCIDMHYIQEQCDKHRKPLSAGYTMLGLVITETDHVTVFCDLCAYVCSVCVCMCERELSDFSYWNMDWTIQHSNPGRSNRLFSNMPRLAVGPTHPAATSFSVVTLNSLTRGKFQCPMGVETSI